MARSTILIVDDEDAIRFAIRDFLELKGYAVLEAATGQAAQHAVEETSVSAAIVDYSLPDGNALAFLPRLKALEPALPVVILTGYGTIDLAVRAIKEGAEHFLTKPLELPALLVVLERVLENARNRRRQQAGRARDLQQRPDTFLGASAAIRQLQAEAKRLLSSDSPVLIIGET